MKIALKWCGPTIFVYKQAIATFVSSCLAISGGLTHGISAVLLPQLKADHTFPYDQKYDSWIASITALSMVIGCLCTGVILDILGRKASHVILNIPYIIGWLFIAFANNNWLMLVGRFFCGISTGAYRPVTLVYIGEITDPKYRSIALIFPSLTAIFGILLSHVIGKYFYWKTSIFICLIPAVLSLIMCFYLRESPLWLISKGKVDEGAEAFKWFRGEGEMAEKELNAVLEKQKEKVIRMTAKDILKLLSSASFVKPLLVVFLIMFSVQACGVNVVTFYAQEIFDNMFSDQINSLILIIGTDCIRALVIVLICVFANAIPTKKAFLSCCFGVVITLFIVTVFLYIKPVGFTWVPVSCMVLYTSFGSALVTWGWSIVPEILPNSARGFGSSMASVISFILLFIAVKTAPGVMATYGQLALFGVFAILTFISGAVITFIIPETNGKTLQAIEDSYEKKEECSRL